MTLSIHPEQNVRPGVGVGSDYAPPAPPGRLAGMRSVGDALRSAPLFAGLPAADVDAIIGRFEMITVAAAAVLYREGEPGTSLFVVLSGKVKLTRAIAYDRETLRAVLGPTDQFGELSAFDAGPRMETATAVTASALAWLPTEALDVWVNARPHVAALLLTVMARRLRHTNNTAADMIFLDVPGRLAKQILELARRFGVDDPHGRRVQHDLTQEELAQMIGASRETLNRTLADFASRGWVHVEAKSLIVVDAGRLAHRVRQGARTSWPALR
jgi:CRP/FNR family cyclic AMP-dependent transcriptional regulator